MKRITLERVELPTEMLGSIYDSDGTLLVKTMELPWKQNKRAISCIPEGVYRVIKQPPKPGRDYNYFRLPDVPGRSGILIHKITYVKDLKGCIGVGSAFSDLNNDKVPDMTGSTIALQYLWDKMPNEFEIEIKKKL